jgi:hypothetical protein
MQWGGNKPGQLREFPWKILGIAVVILLVLF